MEFFKTIMQSKLCKIYQDLQILQKSKLYNKLKIRIIKMQLNIMIADIDKKNKVFQFMNILQLKWILYNLIQKKKYKKEFQNNNNTLVTIMNIFEFLYKIQLKF